MGPRPLCRWCCDPVQSRIQVSKINVFDDIGPSVILDLPTVYCPYLGASQCQCVIVVAFFNCNSCASFLLDLTRAFRPLRVRTHVSMTCVSNFNVQMGTARGYAAVPLERSEVASLNTLDIRNGSSQRSAKGERNCERMVYRHGAILLNVRECSGFNPRR